MSHDHETGCCSAEQEDLRQFARQPEGDYKVTGDMVIGDVVAAFPQAATIMLTHGLHCVGCHANAFDTIEDGSRGHGMPDDEILSMVEEINITINIQIEDIEMTDKAVEKVLELRRLETGKDNWPLRIAVTTGGCEGFGYDLDFSDEQKPDDVVLMFGELKVIVDAESMPRIKGSRIDYLDSLQGSGFKIDNPNASRQCGCGKSFS